MIIIALLEGAWVSISLTSSACTVECICSSVFSLHIPVLSRIYTVPAI